MSTLVASRCAHCGTAFTPNRRDALTCSKVCRQRRWRSQHAQAAAAEAVETMQLVTKCRAAIRDGSTLDGLAPFGVQTLIPTGDETRAREDIVVGALVAHRMTTMRGRAACECGGFLGEDLTADNLAAYRHHVAEMVVEALAWL